jgi:micrococcal nuclease
MKQRKTLFLVLILLALKSKAFGQIKVSPDDAARHIGETVTICEKVYSTKIIKSNMALLNLGGYYPNQKITIVIRGYNRSKFPQKPEVVYKNQKVCVTGQVKEYKGKPEIEINGPTEIEISNN